MKSRLLRALIAAAIAGAGGAATAVWMNSTALVGIVIVTTLIGFFFGLFFEIGI